MADTFATLIVTAADASTSRAIAAAFGPGGVGMFSTPLSASGNEPATHYISSGYIPAEFVSLLPCTTWEWQEAQMFQDAEGTIPVTGPDQPVGLVQEAHWVATDIYGGDPGAVYNLVASQNVKFTKADIEALFARADASEQEPLTAIARLGLQIINPPMNGEP